MSAGSAVGCTPTRLLWLLPPRFHSAAWRRARSLVLVRERAARSRLLPFFLRLDSGLDLRTTMAGPDVGNEDLIRQATKGDARDLERLLRRYHPWMRQVVHGAASPQLLRYADADEIVQYAMTACFRDIGGLAMDEEPQRQFEAWLAVVVRNAVRYFGRKRRRALLELTSDARDAVADKGPTASKIQRRKERYERLNAAISTLPEDTQKMLELRLKGLSLSEIAFALGMKRAMVNSRMARALKRLKDVLGTTSLNLSSE